MMFDVSLPIQLHHRELYGKFSPLFANLEKLQELTIEVYEEDYNEIHAARISEILLWIAANHPKVLEGDAKLLSEITITNLCFRESYEKLDELVPTEALSTLLNSVVCEKVNDFCGYINPQVLHMDRLGNVETMKLAVGKHNIDLFTQKPQFKDKLNFYQEIVIHLICQELNQEELKSLPIMPVYDEKIIYISAVSDQDVDWVLQAALTLHRQGRDQPCKLKLKRSTLTIIGLEAIANGLSQNDLIRGETPSWMLGVSSPDLWQCLVEIPFYFDGISHKYKMECFSFTDKEYEEEFLWESLLVYE